ncbi:MAG: nucleotidyltransferase family protein [Butyrivibrio sp.]|nr:nucleotidyltransferase family protein [Butyrivibrio sp.]
MKTIGVIAEFNPLHNGHKYLIDTCKNELNADRCIVVMSGDFVQRGAPAVMNNFSRAKAALLSGADIVFELPVYYSLGSAEFFARGAVSLLDRLGVVDYLCFGSEYPDVDKLNAISDILIEEPTSYRDELNSALKSGLSYPAARSLALKNNLTKILDEASLAEADALLSSPNSILAVEYIKSLKILNSTITPYPILRTGSSYHSKDLLPLPSSSGIRAWLLSEKSENIKDSSRKVLCSVMPDAALDTISSYEGRFLDSSDFSSLLCYRLLSEEKNGYTDYLDITKDLSNKIASSLYSFTDTASFCMKLKSKDLTYTRISRCMMHILLGITEKNMNEYKEDGFTSYGRILGFKKESSDLISLINKKSKIPVFSRLKDADKILNPLEKRLFDETLNSGKIYSLIREGAVCNEYRKVPLII